MKTLLLVTGWLWASALGYYAGDAVGVILALVFAAMMTYTVLQLPEPQLFSFIARG